MWKPKGSRPSHSQESETLIASSVTSAEGSSISSEFGNLSLGQRSPESEEVFNLSPTKEKSDGAISSSGKESKKGGNGETKHVMIEVQPGGDFKKTVKKRPKHGHDRSAVSKLQNFYSLHSL